MKSQAKQTFTPIHERNEHSHRIVVLKPDGTNEPGDWFPLSDTAFHESGLFASSWPPGVFPPGIFRVHSVAHQTLEAK